MQLIEVYLTIQDVGQAMVLLSQTLASLEKHPNNFEAIKVEV